MQRPTAWFVFSLLFAAACGLDNTNSSQQALTSDAGMCVRDDEALIALLTNPRACVSTEQCPAGAHCNLQSGSCDWECKNDLDCGAAGLCDCHGFCSGRADGGVVSGGDVCDRNRDLLLDPATKRRSCVFDEECPYGSFCDSATSTCNYQCLGTSDPTSGCTAPNTACDCSGRCVATEDDNRPAADRPLVIEATPGFNPINATGAATWAKRRLEVSLRAPAATTAAPAEWTGAKVQVAPSAGLQVSCDATGTDASFTSSACTLDGGWAFQPAGLVRRATRYIWVRPATPASGQPWATKGDVTIQSSLTSNHQAIALFAPPNAGSGQPIDPASQPLEGEYSGTARLLGASGDETRVGSGTQDPMILPIKAWANATQVDLYDSLRVLTPTGKLRVPKAATTPLTFKWLTPTNDGGGVPDESTGDMTATVVSMSRTETATSGMITGLFKIQINFGADLVGNAAPSYLIWEYRLFRTGAFTACTGGCGAGRTCDTSISAGGVCEAGPSWAETPATFNTMTYVASTKWATWLTTMVTTTVNGLLAPTPFPVFCGFPLLCGAYHPDIYLLPDVYDGAEGIARLPTAAPQDVALADKIKALILTRNDSGGLICPRDFANYITAINNNTGCTGFCRAISAVVTTAAGATFANPSLMCNELYTVASNPLSLPSLSMAPCVAPASMNTSTTPTIFSGITLKRSSCGEVMTNYNTGNGSNFTTLASFLAAKCVDTGEQMRLSITGNTGTENHAIYLCPYKEALLGPFDAATNAERLLCYDSAHAQTTPALSSAHLGDGALPVSGEAPCTNGNVMHGIDLVTHVDRAQRDGSHTITSSEMVEQCLTELTTQQPATGFDAYPPGYGTSTIVAAFADFFRPRKCFSPAHFYPALAALVDTTAVSSSRANQLLMRLIAQWVQLHGFLAKEGSQESSLAQVLASARQVDATDNDAASKMPSLEDLMTRMEKGWTLVLSNPYGARLLNFVPAADLRAPDYRTNVTVQASYDQPIGLPALLLETGALHEEVIEKYLHEVRFTAYGQCYQGGASSARDGAIDHASRSFRYLESVEALSVALYDKATAVTCTATSACATGFTCVANKCVDSIGTWQRQAHSWQQRMQDAHARFEIARERALAEAKELAACTNPIGFDEGKVPLFFGDVTGTSSRFFAASDYLLNGWAIPAVHAAAASLTDARTAWLSKRNSEVQQVLAADDADRRVEALQAQYGQQLIDLCGIEGIQAKDVLDAFRSGTLSTQTCFVSSTLPQCRNVLIGAGSGVLHKAGRRAINTNEGPIPLPGDMLDQNQVRTRLCLWNQLKTDLAVDQDPDRLFLATNFANATLTPVSPDRKVQAGSGCPVLGTTCKQKPTDYVFDLDITGIPSNKYNTAFAKCADLLGGGAKELPSVTDAAPDLTSRAECYRGQIGESILGILSAQKTIELALNDYGDLRTNYNNMSKECLAKLVDVTDRQASFTALGQELDYWQNWATAVSVAQGAIDGAMSGSAVAGGAVVGAIVGSAVGPVGTAIGAGVGALVGAGLSFFSSHASHKAEEARLKHEARMQDIANRAELRECNLEANKLYDAIDNGATVVERSILEADLAMTRTRNLTSKARQLVLDGNAAVTRELGRLVPDLAFHYWLDEKVDRFEKDIVWARLLTYLAMRAVEYEYQQSLNLRETILTARHPDQLQDAIQAMQQEQIARTINSRRPESDILVLSLRDDVLNLGDHAASQPGERNWSSLVRFQHRLWSPEYAVYDDDGAYLGQGIPFTLSEVGPLKHRCAEKMWRVSATIQGDGFDIDAPAAPVFLMKRNSFASQWCDGRGDGTDYQVGAMQPASELFHPEDRGGTEAQGIQSTTAMMMPWFNIRRSEFYRESYNEGASEELAGRGLYGDYVLLFPKDGLLDKGFPLEQVEDVLLRFDYLSVDNL